MMVIGTMLFNSNNVTTGMLLVFTLGVMFIVYFVYTRTKETKHISTPLENGIAESAVFLFEDKQLIDATTNAQILLTLKPEPLSDWQNMIATFSPTFPDLLTKINNLKRTGGFVIPSSDKNKHTLLKGEQFNGVTRLSFVPGALDTTEPLPHHYLTSLEDELDTLRASLSISPTLCWVEEVSGEVCWANSAYYAAIKATQDKSSVSKWPPIALFPNLTSKERAHFSYRAELLEQGGKPSRWYKVFKQHHKDKVYGFATPATDLVMAETTLREFRETLTKTFATLSVGLAVFDSSQKLVMFNPALIDLTSIGFEFLSTKPSIYEFFSMLRELRITPEQKRHSDWQQHISLLEEISDNGIYEEIWSQTSGKIFKFTGQPQPGGGIALFLDDISAEVLLLQTIQTELEVNQTVLDNLDTAIVVFSHTGTVVSSNAAYVDLWDVDPSTSLCDINFQESLASWKPTACENRCWDEIETALFNSSLVSSEIALWKNGIATKYRIQGTPLSGGMYMVRFTKAADPVLSNQRDIRSKKLA